MGRGGAGGGNGATIDHVGRREHVWPLDRALQKSTSNTSCRPGANQDSHQLTPRGTQHAGIQQHPQSLESYSCATTEALPCTVFGSAANRHRAGCNTCCASMALPAPLPLTEVSTLKKLRSWHDGFCNTRHVQGVPGQLPAAPYPASHACIACAQLQPHAVNVAR